MNRLNDPYKKSAKIYDKILSHVDYADWAAYIIEIASEHQLEPIHFLDIACGTGSFLNELTQENLVLYGIEISDEMLKYAKSKLSDEVVLKQGDMLNFELNKKFDLITCLFDSINYLPELNDISKFINHASKYLLDNGILIFDAVSQKACKHYFGNYTESDIVDNIEYTRYCHYDFDSNVQITEFTFNENNQLFYEEHHQYIYTFTEIINEIGKSDLSLIAAYSDFEFDELNRDTDRAHFVLKRL